MAGFPRNLAILHVPSRKSDIRTAIASDAPTPPPVEIPEDVPRVYGNFVLLQPGAMDLTMVIGHQVATQPPQWGVQVTVSWEEAKLLIGLLQNAVAGHEHTFGPVADVVKSVQDAVAKLQAEAAEGSEGGEEDG